MQSPVSKGDGRDETGMVASGQNMLRATGVQGGFWSDVGTVERVFLRTGGLPSEEEAPVLLFLQHFSDLSH